AVAEGARARAKRKRLPATMEKGGTMMARARIVQRPRSCENAAMRPSTSAVHRAFLMRRCRSQRPVRVVPASIAGCVYATKSTVPRWCREPGSPFGRHLLLRFTRTFAVQEEAVDGGAGAGDVGA